MSGKRGKPPLNKDISDACKDPEVIKAAKEGLANLDVLVCGKCLQVFHLIHEFHEHKKLKCSKPKLDPAQFSSSAKIWAFMLWKNSSKTKKEISSGNGDNVIMWKHWTELEESKRKAWMTAGTLLWEIATVQQSTVHTSEFEKAYAKKAESSSTVALASLFSDPKLATPTSVTLERVSLPAEIAAEKRTLPTESNTKSKRARLTQEELQEHEVSEPGTPDANSVEEEEEESQEYVVEAVVGKRYDPISMSNHFEIKWEGFPSSQNTWEPEANLTHCKAMIAEFETKQAAGEALKRPCRSSKTKAMEKVKTWVGSKETVMNDADCDLDMEIKIEESDPLELNDDKTQDDVGIYNDFDNSGNDPDDDMDYDPGEAELTEQIKKAPRKQNLTAKSLSKPTQMNPTQMKPTQIKPTQMKPTQMKPTQIKPTQIKPNANKQDPKTATLLVANSLGMVRVNAKALPNIKSGIYAVQCNEQLSRIKPLIPKVPATTKSGLVVITSNPKIEKPGVRRKPLTPLLSNKTKITTIPASTSKKPVQKYQVKLAPKASVGTKVQVCLPPQKSVIEASLKNTLQQSTAKMLAKTLSGGNNQVTFKDPSSNAQTMFTLPPNPGKLPFLVMAPPGTGMGAILITPTAETQTGKTKSTFTTSNITIEKDKNSKVEEVQQVATSDTSKVAKEKETESSKDGESSKQLDPTSGVTSNATATTDSVSTDDIASMDLSMEVTEGDAVKEIDKLISEMTGEDINSEGDPIATDTHIKAPESGTDSIASENKNDANDPKGSKNNANNTEATKNVANDPKDIKNNANDPKDIKNNVNNPKASKNVANNPETSKNVANNPEASKNVANNPEASKNVANNPEASKNVANNPEASKNVANNPEASKNVANNPEASKNVANNPEASKNIANNPEAGKNVANNPEAIKNVANNPEASKNADNEMKKVKKKTITTESSKEKTLTTKLTNENNVTEVTKKSPTKTSIKKTANEIESTEKMDNEETSYEMSVSPPEYVEEIICEMETSKISDKNETSAVTNEDNIKVTSKSPNANEGADQKSVPSPEKQCASPKVTIAVKPSTDEVNVASTTQRVKLMAPQMITIPDGVDPASLSLPPNMLLMVSDNGDYYIVPQQPEGSTVALAQDRDSGEVKMVSLQGGNEDSGVVVIGNDPNLTQLDLASEGEDKYFVLMPDGSYMLAN